MDSVANQGFPFTHVTATVLCKSGAGVLHAITVNGITTAGDATVYDGLTNAGAVIAVLHLDPTTSVSVQPITLLYDAQVEDGVYIEYDQALAADLTITAI